MASRQWATFGKQLRACRTFSSVAGPSASAGDHGAGMRMWKIASFVVALPAVAVTYVNAMMKHKEEQDHLKVEGRREFVPYPHLRRHTKAFPWGDGKHSLFHNKEVNALPEGYEE